MKVDMPLNKENRNQNYRSTWLHLLILQREFVVNATLGKSIAITHTHTHTHTMCEKK